MSITQPLPGFVSAVSRTVLRLSGGGFPTLQNHPRKPGTGGVYQLNDHLWEGKYSPRDANKKRISRNVYAKTEEECEEKLDALIEEMKKEIIAE